MHNPGIVYFDIRGRVESMRLMFEELQVPYDDERIAGQDWHTLRATFPFRELPTYREGNLVMVQSQAIIRHIARTHGLYGDMELDHANCDMSEEAIVAIREQLWRFQWSPGYRETKTAYAEGQLLPQLHDLAAWLRTNGDVNHWVKGKSTYVDFLAFAFLDELRAFFSETLTAVALLQRFYERFSERPRIAAYLRSPRRPAAFGYSLQGLKFDPAVNRNPQV